MIMNCLFFIPFGLLLNINFKKVGFLPKLAVIFGFSVTAELLQYIFAIGATDITDLITNTFGGFLGLTTYDLCNKYITSRKLDKSVIALGILLVTVFMLMRVSHVIIR
jgi:glycopeptide antibiotics resistance protein